MYLADDFSVNLCLSPSIDPVTFCKNRLLLPLSKTALMGDSNDRPLITHDMHDEFSFVVTLPMFPEVNALPGS
jgi:hypothetical protein